jgi:hypothetical protein
MKKSLLILLVLIWLLAACTAPSKDTEQAHQTLIAFFDYLDKGEYSQADALYGGGYEALTSFNPNIDPDDHTALWENGCRMSGLQCLTVRSATLKEQRLDGKFVFTVEFSNPDGSPFILGPCCGATPTEMPPQSQFEYTVVEEAGKFLVMDLPVYMP